MGFVLDQFHFHGIPGDCIDKADKQKCFGTALKCIFKRTEGFCLTFDTMSQEKTELATDPLTENWK